MKPIRICSIVTSVLLMSACGGPSSGDIEELWSKRGEKDIEVSSLKCEKISPDKQKLVTYECSGTVKSTKKDTYLGRFRSYDGGAWELTY